MRLPPDYHSEILSTLLITITLELIPALQTVEQQINELQRGDLEGYLRARAVLDACGDSLASLQIASFERQRYLNAVQVNLSEQLRSQLRNALISISVGIILLSYVFMLYLRQRHNAAKKLRVINKYLQDEVQESERLARQLSFQVTHDSLSGLVNRSGFSQALDKQLAQSESNHGLCFVDLDLFKVVNDTCGHDAGDELIREVSILLRKALPD